MKKIFICAITIALGLTSCSNEETQLSNNESVSEKVNSGSLLKEAINESFNPADPSQNTSYRDVLKYKPNSNKLESIISYNTADNSIFRESFYSYSGDLLSKITVYDNKKLAYKYRYFYKNNEISKSVYTQYDGNKINEFVIDSYKHLNNGVIEKKSTSKSGMYDGEEVYVVNNENIMEVKKRDLEDEEGFYNLKEIFSYDNTLNPYHKIKGFTKTLSEYNTMNNVIAKKGIFQETPNSPIEESTSKSLVKYDSEGRIIENSILAEDGVTIVFKRRFSY